MADEQKTETAQLTDAEAIAVANLTGHEAIALVERIIAARLAPIEALCEEWKWNGEVGIDLIRDALSTPTRASEEADRG